MSRNDPALAIRREEVALALSARGEDPSAAKIDELWGRFGSVRPQVAEPASRSAFIEGMVASALSRDGASPGGAAEQVTPPVFVPFNLLVHGEVCAALESRGWVMGQSGAGISKGEFSVRLFGNRTGAFVGLFSDRIRTGPIARARVNGQPDVIAMRFDFAARAPLSADQVDRYIGQRSEIRGLMRQHLIVDFSARELTRVSEEAPCPNSALSLVKEMIDDGLTVDILYAEEPPTSSSAIAHLHASRFPNRKMSEFEIAALDTVRAAQIDTLKTRCAADVKAAVQISDLAELDWPGRFQVADELFARSSVQAQRALLTDQVSHVRRAALLARRELEVGLQSIPVRLPASFVRHQEALGEDSSESSLTMQADTSSHGCEL